MKQQYLAFSIFGAGMAMLAIAVTPIALTGQAGTYYVPTYDEYCMIFPDRCAKKQLQPNPAPIVQSSASSSSKAPFFFNLFGTPSSSSMASRPPSSSSAVSSAISSPSSVTTSQHTVPPTAADMQMRSTFSYCGNNRIDTYERCDDGDRASGDGCSALCQLEDGFVCPGVGQSCYDCTAIICRDGRTYPRCNGTVRVNYFDDPCYTNSTSTSRSSVSSSSRISSSSFSQSSSEQVTNTSSTPTSCTPVSNLIITGDTTGTTTKDVLMKIAAANAGECAGINARVNIEIPTGFDYVRSETLNCAKVAGQPRVVCQIGQLAARAGTFGSLYFRATAPACNKTNAFFVAMAMDGQETTAQGVTKTANIAITCPVSSSSVPPSSSSVSSSSSSTTIQGVDLSVTQLSQFIVSCRQSLQAQFTIKNNGTVAAPNVSLKNPLPGGTTFVTSDRADSCSQDGSTVYCSMGSLQPGESKSVLLMINVNAGMRGYITNEGTVYSSDQDVDQSNNVASFRSQAFCYDN